MLTEPDLGAKTKRLYQLGFMFSRSSNASYNLPRMLPNIIDHPVNNFILVVLAMCRRNVMFGQGNLCLLSLRDSLLSNDEANEMYIVS